MGFEPTRAEHNGLAVHRLNHSATSSSGDLVGTTVDVFLSLSQFNSTLATYTSYRGTTLLLRLLLRAFSPPSRYPMASSPSHSNNWVSTHVLTCFVPLSPSISSSLNPHLPPITISILPLPFPVPSPSLPLLSLIFLPPLHPLPLPSHCPSPLTRLPPPVFLLSLVPLLVIYLPAL